ncbi:hypothetical protein [Dapis sp. BLCC M229]
MPRKPFSYSAAKREIWESHVVTEAQRQEDVKLEYLSMVLSNQER